MKKRISINLLFILLSTLIKSQNIEMYFPNFIGKSYDFLIFQGDRAVTVYKGIIPENGRFTLSIPKEYTPYKGMSRWLITGTREGGGLDMFIPGHDFSISCESKEPNESNIIYQNNLGNNKLNQLSKMQSKILRRYEVILQAINVFNTKDRHYSIFLDEYRKQKKDFQEFQNCLTKQSDYINEFIRIINITNGIGRQLYDNEYDKATDVSSYIVYDLDWGILYTSGHWWSVIKSWVSIHTNILKDQNRFLTEFKLISSRLKNDNQYTDFVYRVKYFLKEEKGKEDYLNAITKILKDPLIISN